MKTKKKTIALILILAMISLSIYYLESSKVSPTNTNTETQPVSDKPPLKDGKYSLAPELAGISGYLNTPEGTRIADFEGKVVMIDFWTYTCINCIRTLPFLTAWDEKYRDSGLVIIGVHTPEFDFEKKKENVQQAIEEYGINYPVVQDNNYATWQAYKNRFWPHKFLIDSEGYIRYDHIGEGGYEETELIIQELLAEIGEDVSDMEVEDEGLGLRLTTTPELYAGYNFALNRGQNIGNPGGLMPDITSSYTRPSDLEDNVIYLEGEWKSSKDDLELVSDEGSIFLNFRASKVHIVIDSEDTTMNVFIDNEENESITIDTPKLYTVYDGDYGSYLLELKVKKGLRFNAFTFGS